MPLVLGRNKNKHLHLGGFFSNDPFCDRSWQQCHRNSKAGTINDTYYSMLEMFAVLPNVQEHGYFLCHKRVNESDPFHSELNGLNAWAILRSPLFKALYEPTVRAFHTAWN